MNNKYLLQACETEHSLSDAIKLRYQAYRNAEAIDENEEAVFRDRYDFLPNSKTGIVYEGNNAVASVRACIYSKEHDFLQIPAFEVYKDDIEKQLGLDKGIIESNRFVTDPAKVDSKELFKIPFRFIILNALKFNSDYVITAVRPRHMAIYKRLLLMEPISEAKQYPGINVEMIMMAGDCNAIKAILHKDDIFNVTEEEVRNYDFFAQPAQTGRVLAGFGQVSA